MSRSKKIVKKRGNKSGKLEKEAFGDSVSRFRRNTTIMCTIPAEIAPKSVMVNLRALAAEGTRTKGSSAVCNWSVRSSAFAPDLGGNTDPMPGYTVWAAIFDSYRVHKIGISGEFYNPETVPMYFVVVPYHPTSITNNSLTTVAQVEGYGANPLAKFKSMTTSGGNKAMVSIHKMWSLTEVVGDEIWLTDQDYSALVTTNPTSVIYVLMAAATFTGAGLVTGIHVRYYVDMWVEFFSRKTQLTEQEQNELTDWRTQNYLSKDENINPGLFISNRK